MITLASSTKEFLVKYRAMLLLLFLSFLVTGFIPNKALAAEDKTIYPNGIYRYVITSEEKKEVKLTGITLTKAVDEINLPGTAMIHDTKYTVIEVDFNQFMEDTGDNKYYAAIRKLNVSEDFRGTLYHSSWSSLSNLQVIEFYGETPPENVITNVSNHNEVIDIVFIVPKGTENLYANVIKRTMSYDNFSDLYEIDIPMTPTIVSSKTANIEHQCFRIDGFLYQVTSSAKNGKGTVQLIGYTKSQLPGHTYLPLPEEVTYNGYRYKLIKLGKFSLVGSGASVIVVPDTVMVMDPAVFDNKVELLFLSKNCKVLPRNMITDENSDSNLRFVYVPEGITTISENAFNNFPENTASIILPTTVKSMGKKSLYNFKLVTFLNKKPMKNISSAIQNGTTVKVDKSAISAYRSVLNSKVKVQAAKNVVKAAKLTVKNTSYKINTLNTQKLTGTLTKGSNETIFWLSSDTNILDVSEKGVVNPKKAGTAYVIAYTRTSGLYKAIKVTVTNKSITQGIYTYRITDALKKTVALSQVKPTSTTKTLNIPETIKYDNKTYTVTEVTANPDNTGIPLISDKYKDNQITKIVFPKTITGTIGYLGKMNNIKTIQFKGTTAPKEIRDWNGDGGLLTYQAVIYVPKNTVKAYTSALWIYNDYNSYSVLHYSNNVNYHILETGNDQLQRFVKNGILYQVTKQAGKTSGNVTVRGAKTSLDEIKVGGTVTQGKYTYHITEVSYEAFRGSKAETIILGDSITKVGKYAFNEKVKHVTWSKNCKTIPSSIFTFSYELFGINHEERFKLTEKDDFYALETFTIPNGVTTIQNNIFYQGFGNVKSITVPRSVTKIGSDAFRSIANVIYED